jgi:hypothetical protein
MKVGTMRGYMPRNRNQETGSLNWNWWQNVDKTAQLFNKALPLLVFIKELEKRRTIPYYSFVFIRKNMKSGSFVK